MNRAVLFLILPFFPLTLPAQQWQQWHGRADDLSIGADGHIWIVDTTRTGGNIALWRDTAWLPMQAEGIPAWRIAAGTKEQLWFVSAANQAYYLQEGRYFRAPGALSEVAVGADGSVYALGVQKQAGGFGLWRWTGMSWNALGKGAVDLAVDADGQVWAVDESGRISTAPKGKSHFTEVPGTAKAIAINGKRVWILLPDGGLAYRKGNTWKKKKCPYAVRALAVDTAGQAWIADDQGRIFKLESGVCKRL
jgi:hypothetical protein